MTVLFLRTALPKAAQGIGPFASDANQVAGNNVFGTVEAISRWRVTLIPEQA